MLKIKSMFHKFLNIATGRTFVGGEQSPRHYEDNPSITYLGTCDENGQMITTVNEMPLKPKKVDKKTIKAIEESLPKQKQKEEETADSFDFDDEQ